MYDLSFFNRFDQTPKADRPVYVAAELRRLVKEGQPLLTTVLRHPDDDVRGMALALLRDNADEQGTIVFEEARTSFRLRLAPDAAPPERDPQNRKLPDGKRGQVLVAKIGNKGGRLSEDAPPKVVEQFAGPRRNLIVNGGGDLYETAEVGRAWRAFPQRTAVLILRTWGLGVQNQRCLSHFDTQRGELVEGQSFYLVEEEPQRPDAAGDGEEAEAKAARGTKPRSERA